MFHELEQLGFDISTHDGREELRELLRWLRQTKNTSDRTGHIALKVIVALFITGAAYAFWRGLQSYLRGHGI